MCGHVYTFTSSCLNINVIYLTDYDHELTLRLLVMVKEDFHDSLFFSSRISERSASDLNVICLSLPFGWCVKSNTSQWHSSQRPLLIEILTCFLSDGEKVRSRLDCCLFSFFFSVAVFLLHRATLQRFSVDVITSSQWAAVALLLGVLCFCILTDISPF